MATIKDIAKMTGVSVMTVSRALNEPELVKPSTREKIMEAVGRAGYVQNRVARSLIKGCTYNICIYIPSTLDATEPFVAQTISSIGERLGEHGYSLSFRRSISLDDNFDGIIAAGFNIDDEEKFMRISEARPAVLYGNSDKFGNWVDVDNYRGSYNITDYVAKRGYRDIAYIGLDFASNYVKQRKQGFADALKANGLPLRDELSVETSNSELSGFAACERLLEFAPKAIVCATDMLAVGCVHALQRKHLRIPSDVAVTGFDGFGIEKTVFPMLTTVRQPLYDVGRRLADAVVDMINGKEQTEGIYIEPELIVGESA